MRIKKIIAISSGILSVVLLIAVIFINKTSVQASDGTLSSVKVQSIIDGTEPFDDDDNAGNDSASDNLIVRSFDDISYVLSYTISGGSGDIELYLECVIEEDASEYRWDEEDLDYLSDLVVTYEYKDGTTSTEYEYDSSNPVVKQTASGHLTVSCNSSGTLEATLNVKAASNGETISPTFSFYLNGSSTVSVTANEVTVSAAANYNIEITKNNSLAYIGYFNLDDNTYSKDQSSSDDIYGMALGYAITIQLYNEDEEKGLKGIELPSGTITFDIDITETADSTTNSGSYTPILWDYYENEFTESTTRTGYLGRLMAIGGSANNSYGYQCSVNNSYRSDLSESSCYNGGTWSISEDGTTYHVSITRYEFDFEEFLFPTYKLISTETYTENIGCFSVGYIQFICQADEDAVDSIDTFTFTVSVSDASITDTDEDDSTLSSDISMYASGVTQVMSFFCDYDTLSFLHNTDNSCMDSWAYSGDTFYLWASLQFESSITYTSFNILQKFDDTYIEITGDDVYTYGSISTSNTLGTLTTLYAAKTDKTGWDDDDEMYAATEEDLIYFTSLDTLTSAGYTCVGILYEVRNAQMSGTVNWYDAYFLMEAKLKSSTPSGTVVNVCANARAWLNSNNMSWTSVTYKKTTKYTIYGLGDETTDWGTVTNRTLPNDGINNTYYKTYTSPDVDIRDATSYVPPTYSNGEITLPSWSTAFTLGNSILAISAEAGIEITADAYTYNVSNGQSTVEYTLALSYENNFNSTTIYDNMEIEVTIPESMSIVTSSFSTSGTTSNGFYYTASISGQTLTYTIKNASTNKDIGDITFSCQISVSDVAHGDLLTATARTWASTTDERDSLTVNGNYDEADILIAKLTSISLTVSAQDEIVEVGDDIVFTITYTNNSTVSETNVELLTSLPASVSSSEYSGGYVIKSLVITFDTFPSSFSAAKNVFFSTDTTQITEDNAESIISSISSTFSSYYSSSTNGTTVTLNFNSDVEASAFLCVISTIKAQESVEITVTLSPKSITSQELIEDSTNSVQAQGDTYIACAYMISDAQTSVVSSNESSVTVFSRSVSGYAWLDEDEDGLYSESDSFIEGVNVYLIDYDEASFTTEKTASDIYGNAIAAVTTDENGYYEFTSLAEGEYTIIFVSEKYSTLAEIDDSSVLTSLATASDNGDYAYISNITLNAISDVTGSSENYFNQNIAYDESVCTISYDANGGDGTVSDQSATSGDSLTLASSGFTKTGYTLSGWATSSTGSKVYDLGEEITVTGSMTLYAVWTANTYYIEYTSLYDVSGSMETQTMVYDQEAELYANNFVRGNYVFIGWTQNSRYATDYYAQITYEDQETVSNLTSEDGDTITLYAVWKPCVSAEIYDYETKVQISNADDDITIIQELSLSGFDADNYYGYGILIDITDIEDIEDFSDFANGAEYTSELLYEWIEKYNLAAKDDNGDTITAEVENESITYNFSGESLAGHTLVSIVIFQNNEDDDSIVYYLIDLDDNEQTIWIPSIDTVFSALNGDKTLYAADGNQFVMDTVTLDNLYVNFSGSLYLKLTVINKDTGEEVSEGENNTGTYFVVDYSWNYNNGIYTYDNISGEKLTYFILDVSTSGEYVAYEEVYIVNSNGTFLVAEHKDIDDEDQTIFVTNSYTVSFDSNGGEGIMDDMELYYGTTYTLTENAFTYEYYEFSGWNTKADGSGESYQDEEEITNLSATEGEVITLYAQWTPITTSVEIKADDEATFSLYSEDGELIAENIQNEDIVEGLSVGSYYIVNTYTPSGYYIIEDYSFEITSDDLGTVMTISFKAETLLKLASTGGFGINFLIILSLVIFSIAAIFILRRKRRKRVW